MSKMIVTSLIACVMFSAIGGFGAPLLCRGADVKCIEAWRSAATGSLTAAGTLGTLLVKLVGDEDNSRP